METTPFFNFRFFFLSTPKIFRASDNLSGFIFQFAIINFLFLLLFTIACSSSPVTKPVVEDAQIEQVDSFYKIESTLDWIKKAVDSANCVTKNKDFHSEILAFKKYEHFDGQNSKIVDSLLSSKQAVVGTYYKRFTKAIAYRNVNSDKIYLVVGYKKDIVYTLCCGYLFF